MTMLYLLAGLVLVFHGWVHVVYAGHSWRLFVLQPGLAWPDESWAFAHLLGAPATRLLAAVTCILAALGLIVSGVALVFGQAWWRPLVVGAAAFSSLLLILF